MSYEGCRQAHVNIGLKNSFRVLLEMIKQVQMCPWQGQLIFVCCTWGFTAAGRGRMCALLELEVLQLHTAGID